MPQLAVALQNRGVWFKQREARWYTASAYAWSMSLIQVRAPQRPGPSSEVKLVEHMTPGPITRTILAQVPISIVEGLLFSVIIYFLIGATPHTPPPPCYLAAEL